MDNTKVLIGSRQAPGIEAMLSDAPPGVEVRFLPRGEPLREHIADVDILFGGIGEDVMPEATALRWVHQPHAGVEGFMYPAFKASDVILTNCRGLYGTQIAGILGLGGIGRAIAARAQTFEFNVIGIDTEPIDKPDTVSELYSLDGLMAFLAKSNVLMVCCPSTPRNA